MNLLLRFDVQATLAVEESVIQNWLTLIESNYHATNTYHNSTHAADVLQVRNIKTSQSLSLFLLVTFSSNSFYMYY